MSPVWLHTLYQGYGYFKFAYVTYEVGALLVECKTVIDLNGMLVTNLLQILKVIHTDLRQIRKVVDVHITPATPLPSRCDLTIAIDTLHDVMTTSQLKCDKWQEMTFIIKSFEADNYKATMQKLTDEINQNMKSVQKSYKLYIEQYHNYLLYRLIESIILGFVDTNWVGSIGLFAGLLLFLLESLSTYRLFVLINWSNVTFIFILFLIIFRK